MIENLNFIKIVELTYTKKIEQKKTYLPASRVVLFTILSTTKKAVLNLDTTWRRMGLRNYCNATYSTTMRWNERKNNIL